MVPGDTCTILAGTYREEVQVRKSGDGDRPIRFRGAPGESVVIDGTTQIAGEWEAYKDGIYRISCNLDFPQLFVNGQMMVEARWPNMKFPDELWEVGCWRPTGKGSRYGKVVDPALAETGTDWTNGYAVLNVAHQFFTEPFALLESIPLLVGYAGGTGRVARANGGKMGFSVGTGSFFPFFTPLAQPTAKKVKPL